MQAEGAGSVRESTTLLSDDQLVVEHLLDVVRLEGDDGSEAEDFDKHEVEVPVLVLQQVAVVAVLAQHGQFGFRLNLLGDDLNLS